MILSHIVAVSENFVIGTENHLPWRMPDDMRYFHQVTRGHTVIMGRRNYEANGGALRKRTNVVITRKKNLTLPDAIVVNSIEEAVKSAAASAREEVFIVGGAEIYAQTLRQIDKLYITVIHTTVEGDAHYPKIDFANYTEISREPHVADEKNPFDWTYYILQNNKK